MIIIGSGAGGGTLAPASAPSGKRSSLSSAATGCRGAAELVAPATCSSTTVRLARHLVRPDGKPFHRRSTTTGGATKLYGAALYGCARRTRRVQHHDGISPAWPISYDEMSPTHEAESSTKCTAHATRTQRCPPPARPIRYRRLARAADPAALQRPRVRGLPPVPRACGVLLTRRHALRHCVRCGTSRFPLRRARQVEREVPGVRAAWRRDVTLLTNADASSSREPAGTAVTEVVVERKGGRDVQRGHLVVSRRGEHGQAAAASPPRQASQGLANGSDQVGRNYMFHNSQACSRSPGGEPDRVPEDVGLNDYYFANDEISTQWRHPDRRRVDGRQCTGQKPVMTKLAPTLSLGGLTNHAIDFWLLRGSAAGRNRVRSTRRQGHAELRGHQRRPKDKLTRAQLDPRHLDMNEGHLMAGSAYMKNQIPVAGSRIRRAPAASASRPGTSALNAIAARTSGQPLRRRHSIFPSIAAVNPALTAMATRCASATICWSAWAPMPAEAQAAGAGSRADARFSSSVIGSASSRPRGARWCDRPWVRQRRDDAGW